MLSSDIEAVIRGYKPVTDLPRTWLDIAPEVRQWVEETAPTHRRRALQLLSAGSSLASWCIDNAIPVRADSALRDTTIERFCAVAERSERFSPTTRATIRSRLRCLAAAQRIPGNAPPPPTVPRSRVRPPYSAAEVDGLWRLTTVQSSRLRRRRLQTLLACSLGAGCAAEDFRTLTPSDVERRAEGVIVHLRGNRPRSVWLLDKYRAPLLQAAGDCDELYLLGGTKVDRRSVTNGLLRSLELDSSLPAIEPGRLRSTWLLEHLAAGTRLDVLMRAAGITSPASLIDLVPYLIPVDDVAVQTMLRQPEVAGCNETFRVPLSDGRCER